MVGSQMNIDIESVEQYLYLVRHWIMDTLSTVAVDQKTGNIVGFLISRFNEISNKDPEFSRERVILTLLISNKLLLITIHFIQITSVFKLNYNRYLLILTRMRL